MSHKDLDRWKSAMSILVCCVRSVEIQIEVNKWEVDEHEQWIEKGEKSTLLSALARQKQKL